MKEIAFVCTGSLTILQYGRGVTPVVAVNTCMVLMGVTVNDHMSVT